MKRICVFCGSSSGGDGAYLDAARAMGNAIVRRKLGLVYGGARIGLMGAIADEMLALALENQRKTGATNVEFLKSEIEAIPLPDDSVDVIISNCVINLSGDKDRVLAEAFRVLRPSGRLAVSDVVRRRDVPPAVRRSMELWVGCVAGALHEADYRGKLALVDFTEIDVEPTRIYGKKEASAFFADAGIA